MLALATSLEKAVSLGRLRMTVQGTPWQSRFESLKLPINKCKRMLTVVAAPNHLSPPKAAAEEVFVA
jgi:hypothetical protein